VGRFDKSPQQDERRLERSLTDAELLRRVQAGDAEAWGALYERYLPTAWRYVYARVEGDRHLAEDIVSETILALVRQVNELDPDGGSLAAWLRQVARNKLSDHRRKSGRAARADRVAAQSSLPQQAPSGGATSLETEETKAQVIGVMDELADEERLVLEWKYLEKLSVRKIAHRLGRTEKAAESLLYRARRSFRSLFDRVKGRGP
jgi:RNA polymerase sigma-70 factor (ECF subfamily)